MTSWKEEIESYVSWYMREEFFQSKRDWIDAWKLACDILLKSATNYRLLKKEIKVSIDCFFI